MIYCNKSAMIEFTTEIQFCTSLYEYHLILFLNARLIFDLDNFVNINFE